MKELLKVCELKLTYKTTVNINNQPTITSAQSAYDVLLENWSDEIEYVEEVNILLVNRANKVIGIYNVSKGGRCGAIVDSRVIFTAALEGGATGIILSHNHPSGNLKPSQADISLTENVVAGGKILGVTVLDHIIITKHGYYSFADEGMM